MKYIWALLAILFICSCSANNKKNENPTPFYRISDLQRRDINGKVKKMVQRTFYETYKTGDSYQPVYKVPSEIIATYFDTTGFIISSEDSIILADEITGTRQSQYVYKDSILREINTYDNGRKTFSQQFEVNGALAYTARTITFEGTSEKVSEEKKFFLDDAYNVVEMDRKLNNDFMKMFLTYNSDKTRITIHRNSPNSKDTFVDETTILQKDIKGNKTVTLRNLISDHVPSLITYSYEYY